MFVMVLDGTIHKSDKKSLDKVPQNSEKQVIQPYMF